MVAEEIFIPHETPPCGTCTSVWTETKQFIFNNVQHLRIRASRPTTDAFATRTDLYSSAVFASRRPLHDRHHTVAWRCHSNIILQLGAKDTILSPSELEWRKRKERSRKSDQQPVRILSKNELNTKLRNVVIGYSCQSQSAVGVLFYIVKQYCNSHTSCNSLYQQNRSVTKMTSVSKSHLNGLTEGKTMRPIFQTIDSKENKLQNFKSLIHI